jgi:hypothetical protein
MHSKAIRASLAAAVALMAMGGIALATGRGPASSRDGAITACVRPDGQLRIAGAAPGCRKGETVLRWGATSVKGDPGAAGPPGHVGPSGRRGPTGPAGADGIDGRAGAKGDRGVAGVTGATGPGGSSGDRGPAGSAGPTGLRGAAGVAGPQGKAGPTGAAGTAGIAGPQGVSGARGPEGLPGGEGAKGDPGPALTSFGQLAGLPCVAGAVGSILLSFDAAGHATFTCVTSPAAAGVAAVRVNEIATGTATAAGDEFVELANAGTAQADLGGWKLVYRSATGSSDTTLGTIPVGTTLPAGAFYLFASTTFTGPAPDVSFSSGLAGAGGAVGLRDPTGALADSVGWGIATNALVEAAAAPAPPATTPGSSIVRIPDGHDTGNNSADFTTTATPTPGAANH